MRRFLFLLLLGGSTLLAVILLEPGASFRTGSPFYRLCLLLYLLFLGALALSVAFYRRYAVRIQNAWLVVVSSGLSLVVLDVVTHRLRDRWRPSSADGHRSPSALARDHHLVEKRRFPGVSPCEPVWPARAGTGGTEEK